MRRKLPIRTASRMLTLVLAGGCLGMSFVGMAQTGRQSKPKVKPIVAQKIGDPLSGKYERWWKEPKWGTNMHYTLEFIAPDLILYKRSGTYGSSIASPRWEGDEWTAHFKRVDSSRFLFSFPGHEQMVNFKVNGNTITFNPSAIAGTYTRPK